MMLKRTISGLFVATALLSLGCEDPAAGVPKATVDSAKPAATTKPTTASTAAATATSTATAAATTTATAAATAAAAPEMPAGALVLDEKTAKVNFTGSKVTGKHDGKFEKVGGWIALDEKEAEKSKIFVDIDLASVKTDADKLDGHLKSPDFFDVEKFPKATFTTTEIKKGGDKGATHTITGNLNLHGVEKSVTFPATVKVEADKVTAKAEFAINRKDWKIEYAGKADDLIRDDVVIKLDIDVPRKK